MRKRNSAATQEGILQVPYVKIRPRFNQKDEATDAHFCICISKDANLLWFAEFDIWYKT